MPQPSPPRPPPGPSRTSPPRATAAHATTLLLLLVACGDNADSSDAASPTSTQPGVTATDIDTTPTSGALTDLPDGTCGDGLVDPDEQCDDGNTVDFDACSNTCTAPTCSDARRNGDESDIDCGGACEPCGPTATCNQHSDCTTALCDRTCVGLYPTCLEMHLWHPSLPDGAYAIDPDGDGAPLQVWCDMLGGGWTEVARDLLDSATGWSAGTISTCGTWGSGLLGGAGQFGAGATTEKTFPLLAVPHTKIKVVADAIVIDDWDAESLALTIDGTVAASAVCSQSIPASCGPKEAQCGAPQWLEGKATLRGEIVHTAETALVHLSSTLDEPADDEAWGLDRLSVLVQ